MVDVTGIENKLNDVFGKQAPKMPKGLYDFFVKYAHVLTMIGAIASMFGAWSLWNATRVTNGLADIANELNKAYGGREVVSTNELTLFVWLAVAFSVVSALVYFMAYAPLKEHKKTGWNYLFYVSLLSVAYSVLMLFVDGQGFGSFIFGLVFTAIGFWILFQIRPAYLGKAAGSSHTAPKE